MTTKKKLQEFFDGLQDDARYIEVYEENVNFFNELLATGRVEELDFVLPIKLLKYADPLGRSGQHEKALRVLAEVEGDLPKLRGRSKWYARYEESLIFLKAVNLARLKQYGRSNALFHKLLSREPKNEDYVNWYKSNKRAAVRRATDLVSSLSAAILVLLVVLEWIDPKWKMTWLLVVFLVVALLAWITPYLLRSWTDQIPVQQPPGNNR